MNGRCETCDVEKMCAYEYKPTECCNYRKFKQKEPTKPTAQIIQFVNNDRRELREEYK